MQISLSPGADALRVSDAVKAKMAQLAKNMPDGLDYAYANDSSDFIRLSVHDVEKSLLEAIVLVVIVMFVFLQNWRALLVPAIAVPIVLLGTFAVFYIFGYTINTLTLFGLVLAIGLLVDDAIVVVENVERLLHENPGMSPRDATIISMRELQTALVAIALVLCAVFLPMAFFGGSTGVIYRQFSVTMISAGWRHMNTTGITSSGSPGSLPGGKFGSIEYRAFSNDFWCATSRVIRKPSASLTPGSSVTLIRRS